MLATMWWVYKSGGGQSTVLSPVLISVYWIAPMLGSFAATVSYALYSGCTVFGYKVRPVSPLGPLWLVRALADDHPIH